VSDLPFDAPKDARGAYFKGVIYLVSDNLGGVVRGGETVSPIEVIRAPVVIE
jgi:hypothetical protein